MPATRGRSLTASQILPLGRNSNSFLYSSLATIVSPPVSCLTEDLGEVRLALDLDGRNEARTPQTGQV